MVGVPTRVSPLLMSSGASRPRKTAARTGARDSRSRRSKTHSGRGLHAAPSADDGVTRAIAIMPLARPTVR